MMSSMFFFKRERDMIMSRMKTKVPFAEAGKSEHTEGVIAKAIEEQTAKLPSDLFLWAAGVSILGSLTLQLMGRKSDANFVGQWAPTFLILGLYNKIVKVHGHDQIDTDQD